MSTAPRSARIGAHLTQRLSTLRPRQCAPVAGVLVGLRQAVSAQQQAVTGAMPRATKQRSPIQHFRRLLATTTLTAEGIDQPIMRATWTGLRHQRVHVLLDRVVRTNHLPVLVVSRGFRRRAIPLDWRIVTNPGSRTRDDQHSVLAAAVALLPADVRVLMYADSEFRRQMLFQWIRTQHWDAILGMRGNVDVTTDPTQAGTLVQTWLPHRDTVAYLNAVWLTADRCGPVNVLAWAGSRRSQRPDLRCGDDQSAGHLANLSHR